MSIAKLRNEARWSEAANADLSIPEFQAFPKAKAKSEAIPPPLLEGEGRGEGQPIPSTNAQSEAFPPPLLPGEGRGGLMKRSMLLREFLLRGLVRR